MPVAGAGQRGAEGGSHSFHCSGDAGIYEGKWPPSAPPALLLLQACCRGYAAGAMPQGLCCTCSNCCTGHTDRHAPTAALATQISMPQVLHWPHRSACSKCCTGHTDHHAPSAALATQINILEMLQWLHKSACSECCTAYTISMLDTVHFLRKSPCLKCDVAPLFKGGRRTTR